jgi:hypothetical protein
MRHPIDSYRRRDSKCQSSQPSAVRSQKMQNQVKEKQTVTCGIWQWSFHQSKEEMKRLEAS